MNNGIRIQVPKDRQITTTKDLEEVLGKISFKNSILNFNWRYRHKPFLEMVFPKHEYEGGGMRKGTAVQTGWLLWVEFERPDIHTGKMGWGRGRDEIIKMDSWESGLVKTAYVLYRFIIEHEAMEGFQYDGIRIFNPHRTVHELSLPDLILGNNEAKETEFRNSVQSVQESRPI